MPATDSFCLFLTSQDHLTLLNVYNGFTKYGSSSAKWCSTHRLNFKALSRAVSIRGQLKKYLYRFGGSAGKLESCEGDHTRLRRCLGKLDRFLVGWASPMS